MAKWTATMIGAFVISASAAVWTQYQRPLRDSDRLGLKTTSQVLGAGEKICADWNAAAQARGTDYAVMESWLLGYLSGGIAIYSQRPDAVPLRPRGVEAVPGTLEGHHLTRPYYRTQPWDAASLVTLANQQCASVPDQALSIVASSILKHLTREGPPLSK